MKKIACATLCLLASQLAHAHSQQIPYFNGFMLGAALGGTSAQYSLSQHLSLADPRTGFEVSFPYSTNLYADTPAGLVSVGYSFQANNNFVLAVAFTAGYADAKVTDEFTSLRTQIDVPVGEISNTTEAQLTNDFALLLKGGYVWDRTTLFYAMIGPRWGNFKTSTTLDVIIETATVNASSSVSGYQCGTTVGLGVQQLLTPRYSWALEYAYTSYGSINSPSITGLFQESGVPVPDSSFNDSPNISPSTNTLMFMLAYRI